MVFEYTIHKNGAWKIFLIISDIDDRQLLHFPTVFIIMTVPLYDRLAHVHT